MKIIKVSDELHQDLTKKAAKKQLKTGKRVTFDEVIREVLCK